MFSFNTSSKQTVFVCIRQKLGESHITSHENRKNVFKYATDIIGELSDDFGIEVDSVKTDFNQMPHNVRKNAFAIDVLKFVLW